MVSLGASPLNVALTQTASTLPFFVFALPAGAIGDIADRRRLILFTEIWMVAVATVLAVTTLTGHITPWLLLTLTFALAAGDAFEAPTWRADSARGRCERGSAGRIRPERHRVQPGARHRSGARRRVDCRRRRRRCVCRERDFVRRRHCRRREMASAEPHAERRRLRHLAAPHARPCDTYATRRCPRRDAAGRARHAVRQRRLRAAADPGASTWRWSDRIRSAARMLRRRCDCGCGPDATSHGALVARGRCLERGRRPRTDDGDPWRRCMRCRP